MFENLLAPYLPHIMTARDKCSVFGDQVLAELRSIRAAVQATSSQSSAEDLVNRINGQQQSGAKDIGPVPQGQSWTIDYVVSTAAWTVTLNGSLLMASTNAYAANPVVLLPGETAQINLTGPADFAVQVTREMEPVEGKLARSGSGRENRINFTGSRHETERDIMDTGRPQLPVPVSGGASDV